MSEPIFFWSDERYRCLSNFYVRQQTCDGIEWPSNEHFFQGMKTHDLVWRERIRKAPNPGRSKALGRKCPLRADWDAIKFEIMRQGLRAKFAHKDLADFLLATGDAELYEDSPYDKIWGTGTLMGRGPGKNFLGKQLMELRNELRLSLPAQS